MAELIEITTADGTAEAYLSRPAGEGARPGVLFFMDAIGLRPRIAEMADTIASWGYVVLAPNLFYRDGSMADLAPAGDLREAGNREAFFAGGVRQRIAHHTAERAAADAEAYLATLDEYADRGGIGATGYCMGARHATRLAGQFPGRVRSVGSWHGGGLVTEDADSPHLAIAGASAEFAYGHADEDPSMPPAAVAALGEALAATGRPFVNEVFPHAPHGYTMSDTSSWQEAATELHFAHLRALFERTLSSAS
ncbi:dienelactone hydrolase family protein [Nocardioides insulae]|uniref:dienelactone hydrolase family protein n=1 Tax=Nocardioides insulae TaxID=394734 RepID=UPI0004274230|nr:dienelactone hydrolase family protein [Nocardioides insulae]